MAKSASEGVHGKGPYNVSAVSSQMGVDLKATPTSSAESSDQPHKPALPPIVRQHDVFNLWLVGILNILNIGYLLGWSSGSVLLWTTVLYFLADALFVGVYPESVKSPNVILIHHVISMGLIVIPYLFPAYVPCLAYCMLVEINTWVLISKRTIKRWLRLQEALFYASWVILRLVWYPYLVWDFRNRWLVETEKFGTPWNLILAAPILQLCLTGLNFYWTLSLFLKPKKGAARPKQL